MTKSERADLRKAIIEKAIANPAFRRRLFKNPAEVFLDEDGNPATMTQADFAAIERLKKFLPAMDDIVSSLAGEVLCGGGGGCGGLA